MDVSIRPIAPGDAASIENLYEQSATHLRALGDETDFGFNAQAYLRDGFGDRPAFSGVVAILDDKPVGYLLYTFGYDTDSARRNLFVIDLAVDEPLRGHGIGKTLMEHAATICRSGAGGELVWAVYAKNESAITFYQRLGAETITELKFMTLGV